MVASVIVPSYRGAHRLPALLEALTVQRFDEAWEVLIALDGESRGSRDVIDRFSERLPARIHASQEPRGLCATLNEAYRMARGEILIRCDDDLTPGPDMVSRHVQLHRQHAEPVGVIGLTRDVFDSTPYARAYGEPANARQRHAGYERGPDHAWMHWAAHNSVSRTSWDLVGGFDSRFVYGQDSELGLRLHTAGVRIIVDRQLEIEHRGPAHNAQSRVPRAFISGASRRLFNEVHPDFRHEVTPPASVRDRVWSGVVRGISLRWRHPNDTRSFGRLLDSLPTWLPDSFRGKLIALGVEAAGYAGLRKGSMDLSVYKSQKQHELRNENQRRATTDVPGLTDTDRSV